LTQVSVYFLWENPNETTFPLGRKVCLEIDVSAGRMANIMAKSRRFPEVAVNNMTCPSCGSPMKRNGKTGSGSQRWRCVDCGASATHSIDTAARDLAAFVG